MFPKELDKYIRNLNFVLDTVGRSKDEVYIFEDKFVLKTSIDKENLHHEKKIVDYLYSCKVPGSKSICYIETSDKAYYLRTYLKGDSLISDRFLNNPLLLVDVIVSVIKALRNLDNGGCQVKSNESIGCDFVHGDLCLPNILVNKENQLVGFIDLGNAGLGDKWYDYAWLLWSLEYNLKTKKYNGMLLNKLGLTFDEEKYNMYIPKEYRKEESLE